MRTLLCGGFMGLLAAAAAAGLLSLTDRVGLPDKALIVAVVAGVTSVLWWVVGAVRAFRRWVRELLHNRRVRKQRRRELAAARANVGTPVFDEGGGVDDETVRMERTRGGRSSMPRARLAALVEQAAAATHRGEFHAATELLSDVIDAAPQHVEAHLARGRVWLDLGDYNRAMSDFIAAEDLAPDSPDPPIAIGELYFARKDYTRAIACFDVALTLSPGHAMAHCRRGLSHHYRKCHSLALDDLVRARALDPDIPNLQSHLSAVERKVKEEKQQMKGKARAGRR